ALDGVVCFELKSWPWRTKISKRASTPIARTQPQMKAIARRSGDDMLSSTIIVTTEPGLVKATARPRPAITGISVGMSANVSSAGRGLGRAYRPAQRQPEDERDGQWQEPPGRHASCLERSRRADRHGDERRHAPVVAHDEVPPEPAERCEVLQAGTASSRSRRSSRTKASDMRTTKPSTPRIAASPPGHSAPAPSADQKIPNVVSITPTANFSVFSGTRASGARTAIPTPATRTSAA